MNLLHTYIVHLRIYSTYINMGWDSSCVIQLKSYFANGFKLYTAVRRTYLLLMCDRLYYYELLRNIGLLMVICGRISSKLYNICHVPNGAFKIMMIVSNNDVKLLNIVH